MDMTLSKNAALGSKASRKKGNIQSLTSLHVLCLRSLLSIDATKDMAVSAPYALAKSLQDMVKLFGHGGHDVLDVLTWH